MFRLWNPTDNPKKYNGNLPILSLYTITEEFQTMLMFM